MPVSLNITLGNSEKSDALLSALNSALTGHSPNPETPGFSPPSIRDMWLFQMTSLQMHWLFETNPPPVSLSMQTSLEFLNHDVGKVDVSIVNVDSPKPESVAQNPAPSKIKHQKTALQSTIPAPTRQLTWQFDVARLADSRVDSSADSRADLPLFLANTRELHCQFNPEIGLQVDGWQLFELPKAELTTLNVCAALRELVGDSALFPEASKPDSGETNASLFNFEATLFNFEVALFDFEVTLRPRLVRQSPSQLPIQSPSQSHPEPDALAKEKDEGGYFLVFDGSVRILLNVVDAHSGSEKPDPQDPHLQSAHLQSAHLQKKQTNEQAPAKHSNKHSDKNPNKHSDKQSTISPDEALIGEVSISDVLPLHIPITTAIEDLNTLFLDTLRSNLSALASQIAQAMLQQPQVLARFLVLAGELASTNGGAKGLTQENTQESSKTSAIYNSTAFAAKLASQQLISRNVVDAVGLAEQALHLASNKPELPSLLRTVGAVIDGRLGMSNSLASPQIVRLRYLPHSAEKQTESAHLQLEWRADPTAKQSANQSDEKAANNEPAQLSSTSSGFQLTLKDSQGNALLRQPRYLSREMLSPTVNSAGEQVYTYQLPVNTESWPAGVYFVELRSENHASGMTPNTASNSPKSKQEPIQEPKQKLTQERTHSQEQSQFQERAQSQEQSATVAIIKPDPPTCRAILSTVQTPNNTEYAKNDLRLSFSWQPFPGVKRYLLQSPSEDEVFALENCDFAAQWSQGEWQPVCQDVAFSQSRIAGRYTFELARVSDGSFIDTAPSSIQTWQRLAMVNEIELEILLNPVGSKPTMSIWWDGNEGDTRFFPKVTMESATLENHSSQQSDAAVIEFVPKASVEASQVLVEMRPLDDVAQWRVAVRTVSNMFSFSGDAGQIPSQFTPDIVLYPPHIMAQNGKTSGLTIEECAQQIRDVFTDISLVQLTDVLSKSGYEMENANLFGLAQTNELTMFAAPDNPQLSNSGTGES